jgi:spermidine/putrescine transport system substrate-binding protein
VKKTSRFILAGAILFFVLGLTWGILSSHPSILNRSGDKHSNELTVLCPKSWMPPSVIDEIAKRLNMSVVQLTFESWSEFVRLVANTQGRADIICFHSFIARDMINSKFLDHSQYKGLARFNNVSVDFLKMPFDPDFEFSAPIFWGVNGFVIKEGLPTTWKSVWPSQDSKISLLYPDLELLWRMGMSGLASNGEEEESEDDSAHLLSFVKIFSKSLGGLAGNRTDISNEELKRFQYIQLSSGPAAIFLANHPTWKYWLPKDGVSLWLAMVGIGSQSRLKPEARKFIDELLNPETALILHRMHGHGLVQGSLGSEDHVLPMQRASYLREIPLEMIRFPDLSIEVLPRWERMVSEIHH